MSVSTHNEQLIENARYNYILLSLPRCLVLSILKACAINSISAGWLLWTYLLKTYINWTYQCIEHIEQYIPCYYIRIEKSYNFGLVWSSSSCPPNIMEWSLAMESVNPDSEIDSESYSGTGQWTHVCLTLPSGKLIT